MDNDSGQDIPDDHPAIQVIKQTDAAVDVSEAGAFYQNWQFDILRETPQNQALQ